MREGVGDVLHALGATPVITVVEVEAFALEDESADAILNACQYFVDASDSKVVPNTYSGCRRGSDSLHRHACGYRRWKSMLVGFKREL